MIRYAAAALALVALPATARTITVTAGADAQEKLQSALIDAKLGDTVELGAGRFMLTDGLSLDVAKVTVRGAGADKTILDFTGQMGAGEGLLVTADDVVLRGFAVENSKGDGIKSKNANRIVYKNLRVEWTVGPKETNGAYGIYPVESHDVLIDGCIASGASDSGIYVGQSENIIVRNSIARGNVAGIEIENSRHADVVHNIATHNTGGILVFDLPNLPRGNGGDVRVYQNQVIDNDQVNFAPKGNIVATVRKGTGILVMANDQVWVTGNQIGNNATANVMIVSYRNSFTDPKYNPYPRRVEVSGNQQGKAGYDPQLPGAEQLKAAFGGSIPPVLWDGATTGEQGIRVADGVPVLNMNIAQGAPMETAKPAPADLSRGAAMPARAPVVLPASMEASAK